MITIDFTVKKKIIMSTGSIIYDKESVDRILEEMKKHTLLSSDGIEWVKLKEEDYFLSKIEVIAQTDKHLALKYIFKEEGTHYDFIATLFYELKK